MPPARRLEKKTPSSSGLCPGSLGVEVRREVSEVLDATSLIVRSIGSFRLSCHYITPRGTSSLRYGFLDRNALQEGPFSPKEGPLG